MGQQMHFQLQSKSLVEQVDTGLGIVDGFASVYGNEDLQGDVVDRGAFSKTILERPVVKVLFNHSPNFPIGTGRLEDSPTGLKIRVALNLDVQMARDVFSNLKKGVLDAFSIGYDVVKHRVEGGRRHLKELKLWEVSVVTFPANSLAQVVGVKADTPEILAALQELTEQMTRDAARLRVRR